MCASGNFPDTRILFEIWARFSGASVPQILVVAMCRGYCLALYRDNRLVARTALYEGV